MSESNAESKERSMSDTPITMEVLANQLPLETVADAYNQLAEHAKQLERELAAARAENAVIRTAVEQAAMVNGLLTQRAEKAEAEAERNREDAERFVFSKAPEHAQKMSDLVLRYIATNEEWTIDDWRRELDAARRAG